MRYESYNYLLYNNLYNMHVVIVPSDASYTRLLTLYVFYMYVWYFFQLLTGESLTLFKQSYTCTVHDAG